MTMIEGGAVVNSALQVFKLSILRWETGLISLTVAAWATVTVQEKKAKCRAYLLGLMHIDCNGYMPETMFDFSVRSEPERLADSERQDLGCIGRFMEHLTRSHAVCDSWQKCWPAGDFSGCRLACRLSPACADKGFYGGPEHAHDYALC